MAGEATMEAGKGISGLGDARGRPDGARGSSPPLCAACSRYPARFEAAGQMSRLVFVPKWWNLVDTPS